MHTDVTVQTSSNNRDRNRDTATGIWDFKECIYLHSLHPT